jgi:imidazole glycerol-phosphate synthase subunit HisF
MLRKRIIPCLDVKDGNVVKGVQFESLVTMGTPSVHARFYNDEGADELVILDITASHERRKSILPVVESVADVLFIPLTVGGGIRSADDVRELLIAGADRVSLNTAAIERPILISESAERFGTQCVVVAIDARARVGGGWDVYTYGGRTNTGRDALAWAKEAEQRGAGEILLTSMDRDGTKEGYDCELLRQMAATVTIPIIASGGAGTMQHFADALTVGEADAVLAASLFHTRTLAIRDLKSYLASKGVAIR